MLLFLTAVLGLRAIPAVGQERLYVKKDSLTQTLLATKAQLQAWQQGQEAARQTIKIGPWLWAAVGVGEKLDVLAATQAGVAPGTPRWVACPSDNTGTPTIPKPADYLYTTITAEQPVTLTIELSRHERFGGFAYRPPPSGAGVQPADALLWLNGRQVRLEDRLDGYARVPVAKRRGWHEAVLVDLPLERGENRLVVALNKGADKSWFNAVRLVPQPVPALWAMIEHDFPRSRHRLLELVHARWFDAASGWFAEGDEPRCEPQFLQSQLESLAADGATIRSRLRSPDGRQGPGVGPAVAGPVRHRGRAASGPARGRLPCGPRIETLATAYPGRYAGPQLLARTADLRRRTLEQAADRLDPADEPTRQLFAELRGLQREALVDQNPLLAGKQLLFVKRYAYDSDHYYDEFISGHPPLRRRLVRAVAGRRQR